ncbi:uncharacterized protein LOC144165195 isoform X3 [Haemaphysalis longicornis]
MLAYIKYEDKLRAIVPVRLIKNFHPYDDTDFDSTKRVQAFWTNEDGSVEGYYPGRVVALAENLDSLRLKAKGMREPFPRVLGVGITETTTPAASKKRAAGRSTKDTEKQAKKRKKEATEALHENIMAELNRSPDARSTAEPKRPRLGARLRRTREAMKKLQKKLDLAEAQVQRLTNVLLDRIEAAGTSSHVPACQCRQPAGEVVAEFVVPSLDTASGLPREMIEELDEDPYDDRGIEFCVPLSTSVAHEEGPSLLGSGAAAVPVSSDFECPWPQGPTGVGAAAVPSAKLAECPEAWGLAGDGAVAVPPTSLAEWPEAQVLAGDGAAAVPPTSPAECPEARGLAGRGAAAVPPTSLAERPEARGLAVAAVATAAVRGGAGAGLASKSSIAPLQSSFKVADGKVEIGPATYMNVDKFAFIMRSTSDARCVLHVSRHLWLEEEAAQRSLTGQAPRTILGASGKCVATPEKVDIVKNFLAKYIAEHPRPGGPPAEHRLGQVRKHLRSFFTESSRRGKRGTQKKIKPMSKHWLFCIHCKKLTVMRSGCVFV